MKLWTSLLSLVLLLPGSVWAACTDGSTCFCDCVTASGTPGAYANAGCQSAGYPIGGGTTGTIRYCEDFDNSAYNDGTGNAWFVARGSIRSADQFSLACPDGPGSSDGDEGTDADDCYNFVQDNACDTNAGHSTTDCSIGNQSLGQKYDQGYQHAIMGRISLGATYYNIGHTYVFKFSSNLTYDNTASFKNDEFYNGTYTTRGAPMGQDNFLVCDSYDVKQTTCGASPSAPAEHANNLACTHNDMSWSTRLFLYKAAVNQTVGCSWLSGATVTKGSIACADTNADEWGWAPCISDMPGGSFTRPTDQWACVTTKMAGINTASTHVVQTWTTEAGASATILDFTYDSTAGGQCAGEGCEFSSGVSGYAYNNYYRGASDGGYGDSGGPQTRAYRYEDNVIITSGDPVPCSVAMAEILGAGSVPPEPSRGSPGGQFTIGFLDQWNNFLAGQLR